ncbi:unnamed protein product [Cylicostephanus goldi]|uniref:Uncharacterized protein n=1 Tax=Cylicostephanus goldi TaxID=71465 RepID=A0A3P6SUX3_CYLGO|nr:unnamed protein product [Cylicostephanus goldi]
MIVSQTSLSYFDKFIALECRTTERVQQIPCSSTKAT